jgi:TetR/AcrR family transcriptional repressor of nem operon
LGKQDQSIQADTEALTLAQVTYQMWLGAALLSKLQKDKTPLHQALKATAFLLKSGKS